MKNSRSAQLDRTGESFATHRFDLMNCGPVAIGGHDLGTDLYVQLRDDASNDLGLLMGVQVKLGTSWFRSPGELKDRAGWWFRERDDKHVEYWTTHLIPHILVLVREDGLTAVWNYLSNDTIESTGKGIKVIRFR